MSTGSSVVSLSGGSPSSQSSCCRRRWGCSEDAAAAQPDDVGFQSGTDDGSLWTTSWGRTGGGGGDAPRPIRSLMFFSIVSRRKFFRLKRTPSVLKTSLSLAFLRSGSALVSINEVYSRRARLVLGWVTVSGFNFRCTGSISVCNQPPRSTQPGHPFVGIGAMSTSQRAVMLWGWGVKAGMVRVWVAGKTVISLLHTGHIWALYWCSIHYKALDKFTLL